MEMYQLIVGPMGPSENILRLSDKATIPPDPANSDWQEYQKWLAEGNVPLAADAVPPSTKPA